jgi:hypothetical protein
MSKHTDKESGWLHAFCRTEAQNLQTFAVWDVLQKWDAFKHSMPPTVHCVWVIWSNMYILM